MCQRMAGFTSLEEVWILWAVQGLGLLQRLRQPTFRVVEWAAAAPGEAAVTAPSTTELLSCQVPLNTIIPYVTAGGVKEGWGECFQ